MQPPAPSNSDAGATGILVTHDAAPAAAPSPGASLLGQVPMLIAIGAIFYFLVIRPSNNERKKHDALIAGLKKDDEVITASGLYGRVTRVEGAKVELEVAPKVRFWVETSSVKRMQNEDTSDEAEFVKKGD